MTDENRMSDHGSVTQWIAAIKTQDDAAAQFVWQRYVERLVRLAAAKLANAPRRAAGAEDAVQSAFETFFRRAGEGHFSQLTDRDDLWQLLVVITARADLIGSRLRKWGAAKLCSK